MNFDNLLAPFLTWQFVLAAILINAVMIYTTRFIRVANPVLFGRKWFKAILTIMNPLLGLGIACVPGFLYGSRLVERAFVGICAGFLSHFIYSLFVKRLGQKKESVDDVDAAPNVPASEAVTKVEKNKKVSEDE